MSDLSDRISSLSAEKKRLLEILAKKKAAEGAARPAAPAVRLRSEPFSLLPPEDRAKLPPGLEDAYPLSMVQLGMLFHMQATAAGGAETPTYHNVNSLHVRAPFDAAKLQAAVDAVVAEHEPARISFDLTSYSEPIQLLHRDVSLRVEVEDLRTLDAEEQKRRIAHFLEEENRRLVDLSRPPLVRYHVHRRTDDTFQFTLTEPHSVSDGWSTNSSLVDLVLRYQRLLRDEPLPPRRPRAWTYRDFVALERQALAAPEYRTFWERALDGHEVVPLPRWPAYLRGTAPSGPRKPTVEVPREVVDGLVRLMRAAGVPWKSITLAAHLKVMSLLAGSDDVAIGLTTNGRLEDTDADQVRGLFLNTVPLRVALPPGTWIDLAKAAFAAETEVLAYRRYPLAAIQRLKGGQVLFESGFSSLHFHQFERADLLGAGVQVIFDGGDDRSVTHFPLGATFQRMPPTGLALTLELNDPELTDEQGRSFHGLYARVLEAMASDPRGHHDVRSFLAEREEHQLLVQWNPAPAAQAAPTATLWRRFTEVAAARPDAIAIQADDGLLTYGGLLDKAAALARELSARGVGPETRVALCLERSAEMLSGILGVLAAGGAYVPMDPAYPKSRLAYLLEDSRAPVLLTQSHLLGGLPAHEAAVICLDGTGSYPLAPSPSHPGAHDGAAGEGAGPRVPSPGEGPGRPTAWDRGKDGMGIGPAGRDSDADPDQAAYVIYTSGSTGTPKGVVVSHANVDRLMSATAPLDGFGFGPDDVWTLFHSYAFDFSVWEIWGALLFGGRLVVVPYWVSRNPEAFRRLLADEQVTVLNQTPSAFRQLIRADETARDAGATAAPPLALRTVVFGGEALDLPSLAPWFARHGDRRPLLVNMYGITETTVHVTHRAVGAGDLERGMGSVIGVPIPDLRLYTLDRRLLPVPIGVPGELAVGGAGLARGYLDRPELTAERFVPDPYGPAGARLYLSGDLARRLPDGELEYLGRIDHQVKIRGFRIELGEIEAALAEHPQVGEVAVLARKDGDGTGAGETRLVAYVVARRADGDVAESAVDGPSVAALRGFLQGRLPDHQIPSAFVLLPSFPLTPHGKLDRRALPAPDPAGAGTDLGTAYVAPRSDLERRLAATWAEALGLPRVGVDDNFFALGGDSIRSIQVVAKAREGGLSFAIQDLFESPTVAALAAALERRGEIAGTEHPAVEPAPAIPPFSLLAPEDRERIAARPDAAEIEDAYPLSRLQAGMLFHMAMTPEAPLYHNVESYFLQAPFDLDAFRTAVERVVRRHPVLRTSFALAGFSEPIQIVHRSAPMEIAAHDLRGLSAERQDEIVLAARADERRRLFDLGRAPQFRFALHRRRDDAFQLTFTENHAIFDGWSLQSTLTEIFRHYQALLAGRPLAEEPPPAIPFADFIATERAALASAAARGYWRERLAGATLLEVPRWAGAVARRGVQQISRLAPISEATSSGLQRLAARGVPLKSALMAAHVKALALLSGERDVITGLVMNGRAEAAGGEETRGLFLNTLPFRLAVDGGRWLDLARSAFATEQEMLPHRRFPLPELQAEAGGRKLFDAVFNFTNFHVADRIVESRQVFLLGYEKTTETDIAFTAGFSLALDTRRVMLEIALDAHLYPAAQLESVVALYGRLLEAFAADPEGRHDGASWLSAAERQQLVVEWSDNRPAPGPEATLPALLERWARERPRATALVDVPGGVGRITWSALNRRANRIAHHLRGRGLGFGAVVAVALERSIDSVAAMLGVMKARAIYLPIDPAYPAERRAFLAADSGARTVLTSAALLAELGEMPARLVAIDGDALERESEKNPADRPALDDPAYLIYTSGSTGRPKGALIAYAGLANLGQAQVAAFELTAADRVLHASSPSFDASLFEIGMAFRAGAALVIAPTPLDAGPALVAHLSRAKVTLATFAPSLLAVLPPEELPELAAVVTVGEACPPDVAERWSRGRRMYNAYGPTEASCCATLHRIDPGEGRPPLGRAISNVQVLLLDADLSPAPLGTPAELYVGGLGPSFGYLGRPELTAERFVPNPWSAEPGGRLYRSGDLGRFLARGTIDFLGRIDHQIKLRGFRIEPGEIEAAIAAHPEVREAVVVAHKEALGDHRLIAYVAPVPASGVPALRAFLAERLPEHLVPSAIVALDAMPHNASGKIDRKALPAAESLQPDSGRPYVAPRTPIEEVLAGLYAELLRVERVGARDGFFDLGGHSLLATQLASRVREAFAIELPLQVLFESPEVERLAERIAVARSAGTAALAPPIQPVPRTPDEGLPLSFGQERLWFLDRLQPGSAAYHIPSALVLVGALDRPAMTAALAAVVARHEVLRTVYREAPGGLGGALQHPLPAAPTRLPAIDLRALAPARREPLARALARREAVRPFDLARDLPLRAALLALDDERHVASFTLHHIAADGWSMGILVHEIARLYAAALEGRPSPLPPLAIQVADVAAWQRHWLTGEVLARQLGYWTEALAGAPPFLELPTDRPRPPVQRFRGIARPFAWPGDLAERLAALGRKSAATPFMLLLAAFDALLARLSGSADLAVGTPIAGRNRLEVEPLIGLFINTLVVRVETPAESTFAALVERVRTASFGAFAHQELPFERLVDALDPVRSLAYNPLFQVMFVLQNAPVSALELPGLAVEPFALAEEAVQFDLELAMGIENGRLAGTLKIATDLFDAATAERWTGHLRTLLDAALAQPSTHLYDLPLLSPAERQQIGVEWNATALPVPFERRAHELIFDWAAATPSAIAAADGDGTFSYAELAAVSRRAAARLVDRGVEPGVLVALLAARSRSFLGAMLGIFQAGGAYLPLDPLHPAARLAQVLARARVPLVVVAEPFAQVLSDALERLDAAERPQVLALEDLLADGTTVIAPTAGGGDAERWRPAGHDLAYSIFTSGSTGVPKGALVEHRGMLNHLFAKIDELALTAGDVIAQTATQSFDISVWQFLVALVVGGRVEIFDDEVAHDPARLLPEVERRGVTILETVPSILRFVLDELDRSDSTIDGDHVAQERQRAQLASLRILIPTGEALPPELARRWLARFPGIPLLNAYGPTECSDDVTHHRLSAPPPLGAPSVSIGRPVGNTAIYVLDPWRQPQPIGVPGEIAVGGPGVGRGYRFEPSRTAEVFLPDPFAPAPGARLYATGDLGRFSPDGTIEFLGRIDHQVKVRGFRIELGEIESALADHPAVAAAAVLAPLDRQGIARLFAAIVARDGAALDAAALKAHLAGRLPEYMVPAAIAFLAAMPLLPSGKVDRRALADLAADAARGDALAGPAAHVPPRTPTEQILAGLYEQVLAREGVGARDDFFELGGHSLLATQVISRLRELFQVEIPLRTLFEQPTVEALAREVDRAAAEGRGLAAPPIVPVPRDRELPLSFAQQRLWFLDQLEPGSAVYNIPLAFRARGPLDVELLARALTEVVRRHEVLRTTFGTVDGRAVQVVAPPAPFPLPVVEIATAAEDEREPAARRRVATLARRPFDLATGPLFVGEAMRFAADDHVLFFALHHTISDGWSTGVLLAEVAALYRALGAGERSQPSETSEPSEPSEPSPLPELPIQYADYAAWQRGWLDGEVLEAQVDYWRNELANLPILELPIDRPRPAIQRFRGDTTRSFEIPPAITAALRALARREGATLFMTLIGAFGVLLGRAADQDDVVIGTPIAGRNRLELEPLIGFFTNTLVIRTRLAGEPTVAELLARLREASLGATAHQELPFERLVEVLQPDRDMSRNPIFQVMFVLQNLGEGGDGIGIPGLTLTALGAHTGTAKFDLNLVITEGRDRATGEIEWNVDLFDRPTVDRLARRYGVLLEQMVAHPERRVSELAVLAPSERFQVLGEWNDTRLAAEPASLAGAATLAEPFERRAAENPDSIAAVGGGRSLTYGEIEARANRIAHRLRQLGVGPGELVAIHMNRSVDLLPALFGVLKAGAGYLPLEVSYPTERVRYILDALRVRAVLTESPHLDRFRELAPALPDLALALCLDPGAEAESASGVSHDRLGIESEADLAALPATRPAPTATADDIAYVIFTSGSTGTPKGVVVRHRPALNLIAWVNETQGVSASDRVLFVTSLCFDLSVYDVFGLLAAGGSLHVAVEDELRDPERLVRLLVAEPITFWDSAPAALRQLVPFFPREAAESRLRLVFLSGDWVPVPLPDEVRRTFPGARVVALGGATEATIWSNYYPVGTVDPAWPSVPYGRPIWRARYHVLDRGFEPCPIGVPGALYIAGPVLASGYANEPILTASKFLPDPFADEPGAIMYRTGDRARYLADGNLEFLGRLDFQVKIRGFRIELGEIESVLGEHPAVAAAVAAVREDTPGDRRLVAYTVAAEGIAPATPQELRAFVHARLPEYMVPGAFVALPAIPLTSNGKVDRKALPAPDAARRASDATYAPPTNDAEAALAKIWAELLGLERVGIHDNFFELGGDSILSIQIISRAGQAGLNLSARQVFQHQTVAELAAVALHAPALVAEQGAVSGVAVLSPVERWFFEQELPAAHHWNQSLLLEVGAPLDPVLVGRAVAALVVHHDALRSAFRRDDALGRDERGELTHVVLPPGATPRAFARIDLGALPKARFRAAVEGASATAQASLDLQAGALLRVISFESGADPSPRRLLVVAHHLVIDGVSWRLLLEDLQIAYGQLARGDEVELPRKTTSWLAWTERLAEHARSEGVRAELPFWTAGGDAPAAPLPVDFTGDGDVADNRVGEARTAVARLDAETTRALLADVPAIYRTRVDDALLAALGLALSAWTGTRVADVVLEGHGREEIADDLDVSRTVGWFTALYPLRLDLAGVDDPGGALKRVKESLRAVPNRGLGFGLLRYLGDDEARAALAHRAPEISFNYLGQLDQALPEASPFRLARESAGPSESPAQPRRFLLDVAASVLSGQLEIAISYGGKIHAAETIEALLAAYLRALTAIVEHCLSPDAGGVTPSDFPLARLEQPALDRLLAESAIAALADRGRNVEEIYPLSPLQSGLLFHTLERPGSGMYGQQLAVTLEGAFDPAAFERAWNLVIARHALFRTAFVWRDLDRPLQVVFRRLPSPMVQVDARTLDPAALRERLRLESERDFDPACAPLQRLHLFRTGERSWRFAWSHHHLILDGWSLPLVLDEVMAAYAAYAFTRREPELPRARPYRDYIAWLDRQNRDAAAHYWRDRLSGLTEPTPRPLESIDRALAPGEPFQHDLDRELPAAISSEIDAFARGAQLTVNTVVQAAWALLLSRSTRRQDVVFGATVSGRPPEIPGIESMVGLFINTLPVRVVAEPAAELLPWLARLQDEQAELRQFEYTPLVDVQGASDVPRGLPLFETVLVFENYPVHETPPEDAGERGLAVFDSEFTFRTNYPLMLVARPGEHLILRLSYDARRFEHDAVLRAMDHLAEILSSLPAAARAGGRIAEVSMISAAERAQLLAHAGDPNVDFEPGAPLHVRFAAVAAERPQAIAVRAPIGEVQGESRFAEMTYGELDAEANRLARHLVALGAEPDRPIGILLERTRELPIAILGVLKAGAGYLPLDPGHPTERIAATLDDAGARLLVTASALATPELLGKAAAMPAAGIVRLDADAAAIAAHRATPLAAPAVGAGHLAYVIYTSGSTGRPKGTLVEHAQVVRLFLATAERFGLDRAGADDVWTLFHSAAFDFSVWELWGALLYGGRLVVVPTAIARSAPDFLDLLAREKVTVLNQTPSAFRELMRADEEAAASAGGLPELALRLVIFGGEALDPASLGGWFARRGDRRPLLVNMYGITETTVHVTARDLSAEDAGRAGRSPIGRAISDLRAHVLDADLDLAPVSVPGELAIAGAGLARGYLGRPELTAERFVPSPFSTRPGERLYLSGDLARRRADGDLDYLGRIDQQVKIRGFRIELGEIEAALRALPAIADAAVLARRDGPATQEGGAQDGEPRLVAYVVPAGGELDADPSRASSLDPAALAEALRSRLPAYMVPSAFVALAALPLNANGKLDRRALPAPELPGFARRYEAPRGPVEELIAQVFADVLGVEVVGARDNFFDLGGHSLLATQVASRLSRALAVEVPLAALFEAEDLSALARRLEAARREGESALALAPSAANAASLPIPTLARDDFPGGLPLSFAQQRLWFLEQLAPGRPTYNIATPMRLTGAIRADLLARALAEVVLRHEALRTSFARVEGQPVQVIHPPRPVPVPEIDLSGLAAAVRGPEVARVARAEARRPFDLTRPELLRAALVHLATGDGTAEHAFLLTTHHIVSDGWSLGVLIREVTTIYGALAAGRGLATLPALPIQYADYAVWQRRTLAGDALDAELSAWRTLLTGAPSALDLPADRPRPTVQSFDGARLSASLPAELAARVRALSRRQGATPFMTLFAAFSALLARESGQRDLVVGTPIAGRNRLELEPLVGFFVNTLALRTRLDDDPDLETLLARTRATALTAFAHQELPFEQLVDHLEIERDLSRHPLFQVAFVLQNVPVGDLGDGPVRMSALPLDEGTAKFDLTFAVHDEAARLGAEWEYATALFDRATIERFAGHFERLLDAFVSRPAGTRVSELPILSSGERRQLLGIWNHPGLAFAIPPSLPASFAAQARATPLAIAVSLGAETLTYEQLDAAANRLAHRLRAAGVGPESLVGLAVERTPAMIVGLLGILKAGGAYLPLDPAYPADRLAFMIEDAAVAAIVTTAALEPSLPSLPPSHAAPVVRLDDPQLDTDVATAPDVQVRPDHAAYVIYTSGSTGRPKGVVVTHANALRLFAATDSWFSFGPRDVWSLFHSYAFDFSVWEIWGALLYGGRIAIVPQDVARAPEAFLELLARERVTVLNQTPSAFRQLIRAAAAAPEVELAVRAVVFGGEALDLPGLAPWFAARGDSEPVLINMYGITETTVHVTYRPLAARDARPGLGSRIGVPIPDLQVHLLDERWQLCPLGTPGELAVGGAGLARGYLKRPELTAERFVPDPFGPPGARLYRSGDLARRRPDGDLEYLGRIDHQVKVRGFRIELGEIEALLGTHPGLAAAVVLATAPPTGGDARLDAYLLPGDAEAPPTVDELRRLLGARLPDYMIPAAFYLVDELPTTPSGKVDRRALAARGREIGERAAFEGEYAAPRTPLEERLATIWAAVLGAPRVGIDDNFFALGGDSMLSLQIVARAEEAGIAFALQEVYLHQTVRELAAALEAVAGSAPAAGEEEDLEALLAELEGLSDDEVKERLDR